MATVPETPVPPSDLAQQTTKNIIIIKFKKGIKEADAEAHMKTVQERNEKSQQPGLSTPGIQTRFKTIFYGYQGTFNPDVETFIRGDKDFVNTVSSNVFGELYELKDFKAFDTINWALAKVSQKENEWIQVKDKYVRESAGEGVLIYVLDDGYTSHTKGPELQSRLVVRAGSTDPPLSEFGHGTCVADLAAGRHLGAAPGARLCPLKIVSQETGKPDVSAALAALEHLISYKPNDDKPRIINCSWSVDSMSKLSDTKKKTEEQETLNTLERAFDQAIDAGFVVVAAAGNHGKRLEPGSFGAAVNRSPLIPAGMAKVITIGSIDPNDKIVRKLPEQQTAQGPDMKGSNWGSLVDFYAPGRNMPNNDMIQQERGLAMTGAEFNDPVKPKQDTLMGTSYAAPCVSGMIACMMAAHKRDTKGLLSPVEVKRNLAQWAAQKTFTAADIAGPQNYQFKSVRNQKGLN
ncbi:hypothetical protein MMC28_003654 [Mycoblastus sanguinarius]|nr:hypothetical protein [Mycoblastus sanguinarius]